MTITITVGVLALQGAFIEHIHLLRRAATQISQEQSQPQQVHILAQKETSSSTLPTNNFTENQAITTSTASLPPTNGNAINTRANVELPVQWSIIQVRTAAELSQCDALVLPGGESTSMSLIAERTGLLSPLRDFVRSQGKSVWGTCAGMILLAAEATVPDGDAVVAGPTLSSASASPSPSSSSAAAVVSEERGKGVVAPGQALIGGLDVRVRRNHFGRQTDSFEADLELPFLSTSNPTLNSIANDSTTAAAAPFHAVFIRAPVVSDLLSNSTCQNSAEANSSNDQKATASATAEETATAKSKTEVEVLARLPPLARSLRNPSATAEQFGDDGAIVAVRQGRVFATAFHPELTGDSRLHLWWLRQVLDVILARR